MGKTRRLTGRKGFEAVFSEGRSWSNDLVALKVLPNSLGTNRCGFAAGKRLGGAVVRNRIRRRLREAARHTPMREGWDMVFIARQPAAESEYLALKRAMEELLYQARILANGGVEG